MEPRIRYLDDATAAALMPPYPELAARCAEALAALTERAGADGPGRADLPAKLPVAVGRDGAFAHGMPAAVALSDARVVGLKWISGDPQRPPPRLSGLLLLEDPTVGGVRGLIAAAGLTGFRTAAVSQVALQLAPPRSEAAVAGEPWRIALVAGGTQAFSHRAMLASFAPDARVTFVTRRDASELPLQQGDRAVAPDRLQEVVAQADVVITSVAFDTKGRELDPTWVVPGASLIATDYATAISAATVAGVCGHGPVHELPRLIVDDDVQFDYTRSIGKIGDYGPGDVTMGAVLRDADGLGTALRERPPGTTVVVNHLGVAVCDLAVGWALLRRAEADDAGVLLPR